MRSLFLVLALIFFSISRLTAQEQEEGNLAAEISGELGEGEEDAYEQYRYECLKRPLDLNKVTEQALIDLQMLESWHVQQFIQYRNQMGPFISIYELQAIPGWDISLIRKLVPYLRIYPQLLDELKQTVLTNGPQQSFWLRSGYQWPAGASGTQNWEGSPISLQLRYRYKISDRISAGFIADKDAGEPLFKGANRWGFDFNTAHLFLRGRGVVKSIALGDFIINTGQGLLQWQGPAYRRNNGVTGVKRQGEVVQEYRASGEYFFHRGAAVSVRKQHWEGIFYVSVRNVTASSVLDSITRRTVISTIQTGGYHRSLPEIENKNALQMRSAGFTLRYKKASFQLSLNGVAYTFSKPFKKADEPYRLFDFSGDRACLLSVDHSYTWRNMHFFGEAGVDQDLKMGLVQGMIAAVDTRFDMMIFAKRIEPGFTSFFGNAFTEKNFPENEQGWVIGAEYRVGSRWTFMGNAGETINFWPGYQEKELQRAWRSSVQIEARPDKKTMFRIGLQQSGPNNGEHKSLISGRFQTEFAAVWKISGRWDWSRYSAPSVHSRGYSALAGLQFQPGLRPCGFSVQMQYYDTDDYNSRIYVSEGGVRYQRTIFMAYGNGLRTFLAFNYKLHSRPNIKYKYNINLSLKFAQTFDLGRGKEALSNRNTVEFNSYSLQMQAICGF